ncbi:hypothetical protein B0J17DRAFT_631493 [Rhizoctonia solani]|nr:hypothetical protein B0J17DRAFT_631493 [Rhizoctonia solani]
MLGHQLAPDLGFVGNLTHVHNLITHNENIDIGDDLLESSFKAPTVAGSSPAGMLPFGSGSGSSESDSMIDLELKDLTHLSSILCRSIRRITRSSISRTICLKVLGAGPVMYESKSSPTTNKSDSVIAKRLHRRWLKSRALVESRYFVWCMVAQFNLARKK